MPPSRKLLVLALDAASPRLLRTWAADGTLPHLAQLMVDGLVGETRSVEGLYVGATWPSFWTGLNPAGHGIYWLDRLLPGTYRVQRCRNADWARRPSLWQVVSDAGRRVLLMDVPFLRPRARLHGVQIAEWGAHDMDRGFSARPRRAGRALLRTVGPHPAPQPCDAPRRSHEEYLGFADQLCRGASARARVTRTLLAEESWDFAIQVFSELHCAGHQLWHFHDPAHPGFDQRVTEETGDLLRQVYRAVDAAVGEIVSAVDPDTRIVLLDLHGMSFTCGATFLLPDLLARLGVMRRASETAVRDQEPLRTPFRSLRDLYRVLPDLIRRPLYQARQYLNQRWLGRGTPLDLDPAASRCMDFGLGASVAGIRLNLVGREPGGTVAPGAEAEDFCDELTRDLLDLTNADTGRPLVRRVVRTGELFQGAYLDELPDLLVEWDPETPLGTEVAGTGAGAALRISSPKLGIVEGINRQCRTGEHRPDGLLVARGPGIAPGELDRVVSILDLAPSFARYLGCDLAGADGRPIPELR